MLVEALAQHDAAVLSADIDLALWAHQMRASGKLNVGEPATSAARLRAAFSQAALARMWIGCVDHDPTGQILSARTAKEELRALRPLRGHWPAFAAFYS